MNTNEKPIIPIFFATDDNYIPFLAVAIKSLLDNASKEYFYNIHILNTGINPENQKRIHELETSNSKIYFKDLTENVIRIRDRLDATLRDYYTESIFYRIFIASLYPEYKKAIYLDGDIVVVDDISKMYNIDLEGNIFGVITDDVINTTPQFVVYAKDGVGVENYFNSGVLLMDLDEYRKARVQERFVYLLVKYNFETAAPDQDYLNVLCKDRVKFLDKGWDRMPIGDFDGELHIIHYNNFKKPWYYDDVMYGDIFWDYAKRTSYYNEIKKIRENFTEQEAAKRLEGVGKLVEQTIRIINDPKNFCRVLKGKKF
ncbi:MAG: glycosyltransferase family 8 protein [Clostridia bacterium]|nr:glycosyltransferase family 8 protein [Clostridia bacterium]